MFRISMAVLPIAIIRSHAVNYVIYASGLLSRSNRSTILNMKPSYLFPDRHYIQLDLAAVGLPEVPLVGIHRLPFAAPGLREHVHEGCLEVSYLISGERSYHVDGKDYMMRGNDIFVTYPDERHGSGGNPHGKGVLYWLQVRIPSRPQCFLTLPADEVCPLLTRLRAFPRRKFQGVRQLRLWFERIFRLYSEDEWPLRKLSIASSVLECLLTVVECADRAGATKLSEDIQDVVRVIQRTPQANPSMAELADIAGLSESRFKAKFKSQTGIPPGEYVLRSKVAHAEELLRSDYDRSITEIAFALGFSSSQYFATAFRRFTNKRPSEFRTPGGSRPQGKRNS